MFRLGNFIKYNNEIRLQFGRVRNKLRNVSKSKDNFFMKLSAFRKLTFANDEIRFHEKHNIDANTACRLEQNKSIVQFWCNSQFYFHCICNSLVFLSKQISNTFGCLWFSKFVAFYLFVNSAFRNKLLRRVPFFVGGFLPWALSCHGRHAVIGLNFVVQFKIEKMEMLSFFPQLSMVYTALIAFHE